MVHINTARHPSNASAPLLEFVIHNGHGEYDKAPDGQSPSNPFFIAKLPFCTWLLHSRHSNPWWFSPRSARTMQVRIT